MAHLPSRQRSSKSDDWAALLSAAVATTAKTPTGKGWKTFREICAEWGLGKSKARELLASSILGGKVERFDGCGLDGTKLVKRVWYRIKK